MKTKIIALATLLVCAVVTYNFHSICLYGMEKMISNYYIPPAQETDTIEKEAQIYFGKIQDSLSPDIKIFVDTLGELQNTYRVVREGKGEYSFSCVQRLLKDYIVINSVVAQYSWACQRIIVTGMGSNWEFTNGECKEQFDASFASMKASSKWK